MECEELWNEAQDKSKNCKKDLCIAYNKKVFYAKSEQKNKALKED